MIIGKRGFTLIELLIVIALLGSLAVGLLATVDPFEQLKKGRDTSTRNSAAEFYNSVIRFYAQRASFPTGLVSGITSGKLGSMNGVISDIAAAGELKADFINLAGTGNLNRVYVTIPDTESVTVCFNPESKSFRNDQNTKFDSTGGLATATCPAATSPNCYVCFR
ncbi:type II secretion system protein [Candidatus Roizmanbacteria bacterium]|nr:type II secretion system protein [Candidatus Roizmanbacteria bacterium]